MLAIRPVVPGGLLSNALAPGPALLLVEVGPGDEAALLLSLGHVHHADIAGAQRLQALLEVRQVARLGYQGGEPEHLRGERPAFLGHAGQEGRFAALAVQLGALAAKVQ